MNTEKIIEITRPCTPCKHYLRRHKNLREAWGHCHRGDWMICLAQKLGVDVRVLALAKGLCANTVRHLMKDPRSVLAVDAAIAFGRGEMGKKELDAAARAAHAAAADDADAAAADAAAYAAAVAADDAVAVADAARVVFDVADAAAYAGVAFAAASVDARKGVLAKTADICRDILTEAVMRAALERRKGR